jgi:DNA polymerase-3 subunit alpha
LEQNFVHLHLHTSNSTLDGFGRAEQYAKVANQLGFSHLALTDHGNVDGAIKFQIACEKEQIAPIFGIEAYIVPDTTDRPKGEKRGHVTLLAKTEKGWNNILKLMTKSYLEGFFYRPRIQPSWLYENMEDLIIMSACSSSFLVYPWGESVLKELNSLNAKDIYLEVMPHQFNAQKELNTYCVQLSNKYGIKLVATNDAHFVNPEDSICQEVLLAVQTQKKWSAKDRWRFEDAESYYLKDRMEMVKGFRTQGILSYDEYFQALNNTVEIAEKCSGFSKIKKQAVSLPSLPGFEWDDDNVLLRQFCLDGFSEKIIKKGKDRDKYLARMEEELELITRQNFTRYFLIVWELMKWCREKGIMTGPGRGSSSGSLVCYLIGITKVDPIEFNLVFSRFISPDRVNWPDIDSDFEDIKRPLVREHLEELFGKWHVAGVSTFSYMRGKSAIRDVSRVFEVPLKDVGMACGAVVSKLKGDEGFENTIAEAFEMFEDGKKFVKKYPKVAEIAIKSEGTIRSRGVHAAALVVADEDLREGKKCAFVLGKDKEAIINWDKDDIEHVGLMKLDVLGLNMLSVLNEARELVKENHNIDIDYENLPLTDKKCFEEFSKGNNIGCFQVGSQGLRKFCQQLGIDNFDMLVHATSLYRPGPLHSGAADSFVRRKKGEEVVPEQHSIVESITKTTFGILVYQEQIMRLTHELAGLDWATTDKIRKEIGKSQGPEAVRKYEEKFVQGCLESKTISEVEAISLWGDIITFGNYGFSLNHAVPYSVITYWDMYMKIYYPAEFICALLTHGSDDDEKKREYIEEAFRLGLDVRTPKVEISDAYLWKLKDNILYAPFIEIKGVGEKTAKAFLDLKGNKGFYQKGEKKKKISQKFLDILEKINAYEDVALTEELADKISSFFGFSFVRNSLHRYRNIFERLQQGREFHKINSLDLHQVSGELRLYFGEITELKLNVRKGEGERWGGATATIKDDTGNFKFTFNRDIYSQKKDAIEHCEGVFVVIEASSPKRAGSVSCWNIWFMEELIRGEIDTMGLQMAQSSRFLNPALSGCCACELVTQCSGPVLPSPGRYNMMIIGEAPKREDNRGKIGFTGDEGKILWAEIEKNGFNRRDFNATNIVKCWPSQIKTPGKNHISSCSKWLEEEIENTSPFIILALGNTNIKFFTGADSGIMSKNGTTEWNEQYKCWISWAIHPTSVIVNSENKPMFEEGVKNFCESAKKLGFLPF